MEHAVEDKAARLAGYEPLDLHNAGDVCYALRRHDPPPTRHSQGLDPSQVKTMVMNSRKLQHIMLEVSRESGVELSDVEKEVEFLLDEIAHRMALPAVRTLALVLRTVLRRVLHGVYVNTEGVEKLRKAIENWPVVLLPSHRSYLDFILVSYIMFEHNIKLPCIAAGQDFMSMKGVSPLLRRSGAFFLRRTFGSDKLYKAVFTLYVQTVLCSSDHPMEFFIEGTRSRTAKSLHPKLGLLSMVVEPYLDGRLPDIMLVPVSISYERTLEEELFARELLGVPKPKESTRGLFKAHSILSEDYGSIFMHISSPISLHDVCQLRGVSRIPHVLRPKDLPVAIGERQFIDELGHMILDHTQHGMRILPPVIVASVVLQNIRGIKMSELVSKVLWLRKQILLRSGTVHWTTDVRGVVESGLRTLSSALEITDDNVVRLRGCDHVTNDTPAPISHDLTTVNQLCLKSSRIDSILTAGTMYLLLVHYRNQLIHLFVPEAMLALCLHDNDTVQLDDALEKFQALHCALACEFVLPLKTPTELFRETLTSFVDRGLVFLTPEEGEVSVNNWQEDQLTFLRGILSPSVVGVWLMCELLVSFDGGVRSLVETVKGAQQLAVKYIHTGLVSSYEALSHGVGKNALASLTQAGLILQPSSEFEGTGKDRLVKVAHQSQLTHLAHQLGSLLFPHQTSPSSLTTAKL